MAYTFGSITSATPAQSLLTTLDTAIVGITGLTKVSSAIVVGSNTWNVYKSAGANNSFGSDFYFALGYNTASPLALFITCFEGWNTGTLLASNFAPNTAQAPVAVTFANPNAPAALPTTGTTMAFMQSPNFVTTGFSYFVSVTVDRMIFSMVSATSQPGYYVGLYDTFQTITNDPFPLCAVALGVSAAASGTSMTTAATGLPGLATREPRQLASLAANFGVGAAATGTNIWTLNNANASEVYTGFPFVSRVLMQGRATGAYRGLLKDVFAGPAQSNNGDTLTWTLGGTNFTATRAGTLSGGLYFLQA